MNFKTTYVLFAVLALVLGVFVFALFLGPNSGDNSAYVLPSMHATGSPLPAKDIDRIEIERSRPEESKIVLVREGDKWRITAPREYRADRLAVEDLLRQIYDARRETQSDATNNLSQYGLQPPAVVITLKKEKDSPRQVALNIGEISPGEASAVVYVNSSDRPKEVLAVAKKDIDKVLVGLADLRSRDLLSPASGDIQEFTISQREKGKAKKGPLELKKGSEDRWTYVQPSYGDAQASGSDPAATDKPPSNVQSVLTDIANLRLENGKSFIKDDVEDLGKYHLDSAKDDILRIAINRVEEIKTDEEGKKDKKTVKVALLVGVGEKVGDNKDQYYAYIDDDKHKDIVEVPVKKIERFLKLLDKPDALRDRNLITLRGKPDAIDIKTDSWGLLEFRRDVTDKSPEKPWKLWRGDKSYAVDSAAMQNLTSLLTAQNQIETFVDDAKERGKLSLDKPDAVVKIWADSLPAEDKKKDEKKDDKEKDKKEEKKNKKPEPKDKNKPAFTLKFGKLYEGKAAVERQRDDEKTTTVVLVPIKLRDQVRNDGPLAYLDKQLPSFNENRFDAVKNVTKLTLTRDGTTYEISRAKKDDAAWKIDKPADFAGRTADRRAVEDILRDLNTLKAVRIVTDKIPEPKKLDEWGLKNPLLKAVVTLTKDDKAKTFEYDFGKETSDSGVYLRTSQQDAIAIVGVNVAKNLKRELQDPSVFHFDAAKVKEVKITGWLDLQEKRGIHQPDVLDVKRDKDEWSVQTPKGFKLDAGKLDDFVKTLADLKATKFVAHKAKPEDKHGLNVAKDKGSLQIEITVEGEKEPLRLTVGKADGDAFFAVSNKLSGDIFDVRKDIFDKVKEGPGYFSKQ